MTATTMNIKVGDTAPALAITCTQKLTPTSAVTPVDFTGFTAARVVARWRGTNTIAFTDNSPTIVGNVITHQWVAGQTDVAGKLDIEAIVTVGGREQTFPSSGFLTVWIRNDIS